MPETASTSVTSPLLESAEVPLLCTLPLVSPRSPLIDAPIAALVDEAAAAGFSSASACVNHPLFGMATDDAVERFFARVADATIPIRIAEVINIDLWGSGDQDEVFAAHTRELDLCARTGATSVNTIAWQAELPPLKHAGANLARLCDLAADRGLQISFEFLPFCGACGIRSLGRLIEAADRDNLGVVLDLWHWGRSPEGQDLDALRALPGERIHVLQLDDVAPEAAEDLVAETQEARLLPGEGAGDTMAVLEALDAIGAAPIIAAEVFNTELIAQGPAENARRQFAAGEALWARYRDLKGAAASPTR